VLRRSGRRHCGAGGGRERDRASGRCHWWCQASSELDEVVAPGVETVNESPQRDALADASGAGVEGDAAHLGPHLEPGDELALAQLPCCADMKDKVLLAQ